MTLTLIRLLTLLIFRTFLWGLITANFDEYNLIGGLVLSIIIPVGNYKHLKLRAIVPSIIRLIKVPIQMIKETFELMLIKDPEDVNANEKKDKNARKGSNLATFIDVLVITATPMSLVTGIEDEKTWKTHTLKERGAEQ
jgi:multisubunit Na+/H+ antiporter MnhE subunit